MSRCSIYPFKEQTLEIKSKEKSLPGMKFQQEDGTLLTKSFMPKVGEAYLCVEACVVGDQTIQPGVILAATIKNAKATFYKTKTLSLA